MARLKPPGRLEKSISFLCCDHSVSEERIDSFQGTQSSKYKDIKRTDLEILRNVVILLPWQRYALDERVLLPLEVNNCLVENDTFVLLRKHLHDTFHKVLCQDINLYRIDKHEDIGLPELHPRRRHPLLALTNGAEWGR